MACPQGVVVAISQIFALLLLNIDTAVSTAAANSSTGEPASSPEVPFKAMGIDSTVVPQPSRQGQHKTYVHELLRSFACLRIWEVSHHVYRSSGLSSIFAYRSSVASRSSADAAHEQIKRQEEREIKEHASKFSAWLIIETNINGCTFAKLRYVNTSDFPVYAVRIASVAPETDRLFHIPLVEPTSHIKSVYLDGLSDWLAGQIEDINKRNQEEDNVKPATLSGDMYKLAAHFRLNPETFKNTVEKSGMLVQFRDHSGRTWARDPSGHLRKSHSAFMDEWESIYEDPMQNVRDAIHSRVDVGKLWKDARRISKWKTFEVHLENY